MTGDSLVVKLAWLAAAGALGTISRFAALAGVRRIVPEHWPAGILIVNALGCFLAAGLVAGAGPGGWLRPSRAAVVMTGFLGAFTTYSAFAVESSEILQKSGPAWAVVYLIAHVAVGAAAYGLGWWAFR